MENKRKGKGSEVKGRNEVDRFFEFFDFYALLAIRSSLTTGHKKRQATRGYVRLMFTALTASYLPI